MQYYHLISEISEIIKYIEGVVEILATWIGLHWNIITKNYWKSSITDRQQTAKFFKN